LNTDAAAGIVSIPWQHCFFPQIVPKNTLLVLQVAKKAPNEQTSSSKVVNLSVLDRYAEEMERKMSREYRGAVRIYTVAVKHE